MLTLNDKPLATWYDGGNVSTFKLEGFDDLHAAWDWAKAQDGQDLVVSRDGGEVRRYGGYEITDVGVSGDIVTVRAQRKLEPDTEAAIRALESNVATAQQAAQAAMKTAQEAGAVHDQAIGELGVSTAALLESNTQLTASNADVLQAIGELGAMVAAMQVSPDTPSHKSGGTA